MARWRTRSEAAIGGEAVADSTGPARSEATGRRPPVWIVRRLASGILVLVVVSMIVFAATTALPGDAARAVLGPQASPAQLAVVRHELDLDEPLVPRYLRWMGDVVRGDLGRSLAGGKPVSTLIGERIVNSLALLLCTALIAIPASIALGAFLALHRDGPLDKAVLGATLGLLALPDFVVGALTLILLATTVLTILPATSTIPPGQSPFAEVRYLVLPVLSLSLIAGAYLVRMMRTATIEILESDYIAMARLRGVPRRRTIWRHAVPNALVPAVQGSALMLTYVLGGVVLVEFIFNFPGLGSLLSASVERRDVPTVQAVTLVFAAGVVLFNLVADVLTVSLTPELRTRDDHRGRSG